MFLYVRFEVHQIIRFYLKQVNRKLWVIHWSLIILCFRIFFISIIFHHDLQKSVFFVTSSLFPPAFLTAT